MPPAEALTGKARTFDAVGGMQNHTTELTRALDRHTAQTVVTTCLPGVAARERFGSATEVIRLGIKMGGRVRLIAVPD